tara:strand:- start:870 stop:1580 length:711 start_codon:yes stop_codon:yes gene_type:complete
MINHEVWLKSISKNNSKFEEDIKQLDAERWVNTISKKKTYSSFKKYSLTTFLFICGLLLVSALKNETRNLQKEINNLEASINLVRFDLEQAILDNEVITSPENISRLAKEHLNINLATYKRSQIKKLNSDRDNLNQLSKINKKKNKKITDDIKSKVAKKIEHKKMEIKKLQELYANPESIPGEVRTQVARKIKQKKIELKNIYHSPKDTFTLEKIQKWGAVQLVKVFLGIPIIPGR